jgi:hypothetical protein
MDSISPSQARSGSPIAVSPARPSHVLLLGRVFTALLATAGTTSVLSTLSFIVYLALPTASGQPRTHFTLFYGIGIGGLAVAEACQILGVVILIAQWVSRNNVEKKPRELAVLLFSLIPYMVLVIFLITLFVYLRDRRQDRSSERTQEAAQELKERVVDTLIDAGANTSNSLAGSPTSAARASAGRISTRPSLHEAVRRVVGPSTSKNISDSTRGLMAFTAVALVISAVATAGVVLPAKGLAPSNQVGRRHCLLLQVIGLLSTPIALLLVQDFFAVVRPTSPG